VDSQPEYLEDIRLPGEQEVLDSIDSLRNEIAEKEEAASRLRRFRKLIGTASGTTLENLIIDALNVILDASDLSAEDREDVGAEDFWIIDSKGDVALAESKGIGAHVRRTNINQVDDHRDAHDLKTDDTPGLLIVNVFRNSDGEEAPKRSLPVSPDVVAHAARNNVLVLRTVDLFNLLHRRLNGADAAAEFTKGLKAGGGWLEVATESSELHQ
jgi:hypothetical protein